MPRTAVSIVARMSDLQGETSATSGLVRALSIAERSLRSAMLSGDDHFADLRGGPMNAGPPRSHYRATFTVLAAATAAYALLQSLVIPVLPTIQAGLHTSQNTVTWVLTAYLLSASIFTPIMGRLGDMWGKERMLVAALVALTLGSVLAALTGSIVIMIVAR